MAYKYVNIDGDDLKYVGNSTDTKPTNADNGAKLLELDTLDTYIFGNDVWTKLSESADSNMQIGDDDVSNSNPVPISDSNASITVDQSTHDNFNCNANIQVNNADNTVSNPAFVQLTAGSAKVGSFNIRNNSNDANIDPLSEATFTARFGEVQATPTTNTLLGRLKDLLTGIVLSTGSSVIGKVGVQVSSADISTTNPMLVKTPKGSVVTAINNVSDTTTSDAIDTRNYDAIMLYIDAGSTWTVKITGCDTSDGTFKDCYDNNSNPLSCTNITANRVQLFIGLPEYIKIVATEISGTSNCTVKYQLRNI